MYFVYGLGVGLFLGGFLAYQFADSLIAKTVAEYKKLEAAAAAAENQVQGSVARFVADVKKDL